MSENLNARINQRIQFLESQNKAMSEEIESLKSCVLWLYDEYDKHNDFINHKDLDDEYVYFSKHAHRVQISDYPFSKYTL